MKKHINVPIFIPHVGCPNGCVFCNQRTISGHRRFERESVRAELERAFLTVDGSCPVQIAFFGGSFTGIDREDMRFLLGLAYEYIEKGVCDSVRVSTRPDYIDRAVLEELRRYRVATVELGVQSMDDAVLTASRRGHTAQDTERAFALLREYGFETVGQMMIGLPASTREKETETARRIVAMGASAARIYPTVVFAETELHGMMRAGVYEPLTTEDAVSRSAAALSVFVEGGVPVIRLGLQSTELLDSSQGVVGGAYHPALGELVYGRYHRELAERAIDGLRTAGCLLILRVAPSDVSSFIGQKGANREYLIRKYALRGVRVLPDGAIPKHTCSAELLERDVRQKGG